MHVLAEDLATEDREGVALLEGRRELGSVRATDGRE